MSIGRRTAKYETRDDLMGNRQTAAANCYFYWNYLNKDPLLLLLDSFNFPNSIRMKSPARPRFIPHNGTPFSDRIIYDIFWCFSLSVAINDMKELRCGNIKKERKALCFRWFLGCVLWANKLSLSMTNIIWNIFMWNYNSNLAASHGNQFQ